MNEIKTIKKNSKKGFTLVELVVVIAILAILAAIAIPVVSSTIQSSQRSSALSNAQTVELALKEAQAQIAANDKTVFTNGANTTIAEVMNAKSLQNVPTTVTIGSDTFTLSWNTADDKCYYMNGTANLDTSITPLAGGTISALNTADATAGSLMALF